MLGLNQNIPYNPFLLVYQAQEAESHLLIQIIEFKEWKEFSRMKQSSLSYMWA